MNVGICIGKENQVVRGVEMWIQSDQPLRKTGKNIIWLEQHKLKVNQVKDNSKKKLISSREILSLHLNSESHL